MKCVACQGVTQVVDCRSMLDEDVKYRRRECTKCGAKSKTYEISEEDFQRLTLWKRTQGEVILEPLLKAALVRLRKGTDDVQTILDVLFTPPKTRGNIKKPSGALNGSPSPGEGDKSPSGGDPLP